MRITKPDNQGNAPNGLKNGDLVITAVGVYKIVSLFRALIYRKARYNPINKYWSEPIHYKNGKEVKYV